MLSGQAPELEKHYPSTERDGDAEAAWPAVHELIAGGRAEVVDALAHPLQTNAPTRAKALVGALCLIAERTGLPLRLLEPGASAGLNLRLDRFRYEQDGTALGPADSPVRFVNFLTGGRPPLATGFQVGERAGCDLNPIDPTTDDGRLTLLACVFPDEHDRFDLLERAIAVARETPHGWSAPTCRVGWPRGSRRLDREWRRSSITPSSGATCQTTSARPPTPRLRPPESAPPTRPRWRSSPSRSPRRIHRAPSCT